MKTFYSIPGKIIDVDAREELLRHFKAKAKQLTAAIKELEDSGGQPGSDAISHILFELQELHRYWCSPDDIVFIDRDDEAEIPF